MALATSRSFPLRLKARSKRRPKATADAAREAVAVARAAAGRAGRLLEAAWRRASERRSFSGT